MNIADNLYKDARHKLTQVTKNNADNLSKNATHRLTQVN